MLNNEELAERKSRSEAKLRAFQVPICDWLPYTEPESDISWKAPRDVARRCLILCAVSVYAQGMFHERILPWLKTENLWQFCSKSEKRFFREAEIYDKQRMQLSWRMEGIVALLWSLGRLPELDWPTELCDFRVIAGIVPALGQVTTDFVASAAYRPISEILDQIDLYYRLHWAVVDENLNNREMPAGVNGAIVFERRYALEWLIYSRENIADTSDIWDEIPMDT